MNVMDVMAWTWPGSRATATATVTVQGHGVGRHLPWLFPSIPDSKKEEYNFTTLVSINQLNPKTLVLKIKTPTQIPTSDKSM